MDDKYSKSGRPISHTANVVKGVNFLALVSRSCRLNVLGVLIFLGVCEQVRII